MESNTFQTNVAKQSSAITQPVGLRARGRIIREWLTWLLDMWGGGVGSVANPGEYLRWGISGEILVTGV